MKKAIVFLCLLAVFSFSFAGNISVEDAKLVSKNFISERCASEGIKINVEDFSLQYTSLDDDGTPVYYRFQIKDKGFIIVSATDLVTPVLAYSTTHNFKEGIASECFIESYDSQIKYLKKNNIEALPTVKENWNRYMAKDFTPKSSKGTAVVGPLITAEWNQGRYYNTYCPYDNRATSSPTNQDADFDNHVPAGCVAVAMGMIMHYYRYPTTGIGFHWYRPENYPQQTQAVNFATQVYNYDAMIDKPTTYTNEIAKLIHHAGVSVDMNYNHSESGANSYVALTSLKDYFNYNSSAEMRAKAAYSDAVWISELKSQLDNYYPLYYSAHSAAGGHAFILDGYDDQNYFHVNWGWGGSSNGYFTINNLNPAGSSGVFNQNAQAMFNLYPRGNSPACTGYTRNTAASGTIASGPGHRNYVNNADCRWMIAAPGATKYTFTVKKLDTELNEDVITIYNGPTEASGVAATYSGNTLPGSSLAVTADSVLVTFTSNATVNAKGFVIIYTTDHPSQGCSSTTDPNISGTIEFSTEDDYRNDAQCTWLLRPANTSQFRFSFSQFDLASGDFVDVYDDAYNQYNINKPVLFKKFDTSKPPTLDSTYTLTATKMKVIFVSDNWDNGQGFKLNWHMSVGIDDEITGLQNISIYPNPARDYITLDLATETPEQIRVNIVDMTGKLIQSEVIDHTGGELNRKLPIHGFATGLYFMQLETAKGKSIQKFIVD